MLRPYEPVNTSFAWTWQGVGCRPRDEGEPVGQIAPRCTQQHTSYLIAPHDQQQVHIFRGAGAFAQAQLHYQAALQDPGIRLRMQEAGQESVECHQFSESDQ
jgi:hypothetical protein